MYVIISWPCRDNTQQPGQMVLVQFSQKILLGDKCNRKIHNIPYKPLSERMLEEPFWLGLIAVTVVMSVIGICYLFKKHLPDKFDKILSTGSDLTKNTNAEGQIGKENYYRPIVVLWNYFRGYLILYEPYHILNII